MAISYVTNELLQDSQQVGRFLQEGLSGELAFKLDDAIVNGSGVGQPLGFRNSAALVSVPKKGSQTADTVVAENVTAMWARLPAGSRRTAVWLVNSAVESQLPLMTVGQMPVYLPAGSLRGNQDYGLLMGRPVIPCEQCNELGEPGDICLVDLQQYLLIQRPPDVATSLHLRFLSDEMTFRAVWRVNGCPLWASPMTQFKGGATQSPFVTLDQRT